MCHLLERAVLTTCRCRAAKALLATLALLGSFASANAQDAVAKARARPVDPYTQADPAAMAKAGYVSLGPFPFGTGHGTADIETLLGTEPLLWIETNHFRIGCALSPLELRGAEEEWVGKTRGELKRLKVRLPKVKADTRDLDPWLRTHLIAQRCEDLFTEIRTNLAVPDAQFPASPGHDRDADPRRFYGLGPHFGMPEKFAVLIVQRGASLARYTKAYQGLETQDPRRHFDPGFGCMIFAVAEETTDGLLKNDFALHTHLVYNLAFTLYNSYRFYGHDLPPWLVGGLAHWHGRRICPRFPAYERRVEGDERETRDFWRWDERAPGLLRNRAFESIEKLMARTEVTAFGMEQHIQAWAFVDFLMNTRKAATMQYLHEMKDPFHDRRRPPSTAEFLERSEECRQRAFGMTAAELETAWRAHLLRARPKK